MNIIKIELREKSPIEDKKTEESQWYKNCKNKNLKFDKKLNMFI